MRKIRKDKKTHEERALTKRNRTLRTKYGITHDDYLQMVAEQGDCCAICGTTDKGTDRHGIRPNWMVDHNHETGEVRRLLCFECNTGLGKFADSPDRLIAAAMYLLAHGNERTYEHVGN